TKFIPDVVFRLPRPQIVLFLNRLFSGDGCVQARKTGQVTVDYASKSKRLITSVQHLLLRLSINARLIRKKSGHYRLYVYGRGPCRRFLQEVGFLQPGRASKAEA